MRHRSLFCSLCRQKHFYLQLFSKTEPMLNPELIRVLPPTIFLAVLKTSALVHLCLVIALPLSIHFEHHSFSYHQRSLILVLSSSTLSFEECFCSQCQKDFVSYIHSPLLLFTQAFASLPLTCLLHANFCTSFISATCPILCPFQLGHLLQALLVSIVHTLVLVEVFSSRYLSFCHFILDIFSGAPLCWFPPIFPPACCSYLLDTFPWFAHLLWTSSLKYCSIIWPPLLKPPLTVGVFLFWAYFLYLPICSSITCLVLHQSLSQIDFLSSYHFVPRQVLLPFKGKP